MASEEGDGKPYDQIARAVGDVCLRWVTVEHVIHDIALHLASYLDAGFERRPAWDILHITLSHMDVRQKISTAKALAHHVDVADSPEFYEKTETLLNYLDNVVRPERNRFVHDYWKIESGEILRAKMGAKVDRPQSRQRILTLWIERRYSNPNSINAYVVNLELAYHDLVELDNHIAWLAGRRDSRVSHSQPLPQEWKSLTHREWRERGTP